MPAPVTVAAFDFDGTLTTTDTVVPFLRLAVGPRRLALAALRSAPRLVAAALDDGRRDAAKAAVLRRCLAGEPDADLRGLGAAYAELVVAHRLRRESVERLEQHRSAGDKIVIVSASLALYLDAVGALLGVDAVLGTELEVGLDGRLTGELHGANCRRAEKVRRLDAWLAAQPWAEGARIQAYGDSRGDDELLARADEGMRL